MSQNELWLMDLGGNKRQLTRAGQLSEYPTWSPSGRELAFNGIRGGNFEIMRISARGGRERNLTNHPADDKWPDWSPDGKRIAFVRDDDVFVMRADGRDVRNVSRTPDLYENHPEWTPDGRLSFLQHGESGPVHVRVLDPAGAYDLPIDAVFVFDWSSKGPA
jgi:TolB protein